MIKTTILKLEDSYIYPYIGKLQSNNLIVLFAAPGCGTVLHFENKFSFASDHKVGEYREDWIEENFHRFNQGVYLINT